MSSILARVDTPVRLAGMMIVASAITGLFLATPAPVSFVVSSNTRAFTLEWPCETGAIQWRLPGARYWTADLDGDYRDLGQGSVMIRHGAVVDFRRGPGGAVLVEVRRTQRPGFAEGPIAEVQPAAGEALGIMDALVIRLPLGDEPLALPIRGLVRLGGTVVELGAGSDILVDARILARGQPKLGRETRTFLTEEVGPGSLIFSHPELEPAAGTAAAPLPDGGWTSWCRGGNGGLAGYSVGVAHLTADGPMRLSFLRHGDAIGLQTLGAVVPDNGQIVRLSVTRWARWISSAWVQTALVLMAALLTVVGFLYQGANRNLFAGRP